MEQLKFDGLVYYEVFEPGAWKYIGQYARGQVAVARPYIRSCDIRQCHHHY